MPKRQVKRVRWEIESERLVVSPAMARRIKKGVQQRSLKTLSEFSRLVTSEEIFYGIPGAAFAAINLDRPIEAADLARRAIELAAANEKDWNHGNALHAGHTVLGLLALQEGEIEEAIRDLHASGNVRGSPQLASFGPSMQLAKELLIRGQVKPVVEFLCQCRSFWESGDLWLDVWKRKIESGRVPNFFMNLHR